MTITAIAALEMTAQEVAEAKLEDSSVPGFVVSMDPDEAELLGAFEEHALSDTAAMESAIDARELSHE